jgi:hypothetical protein
VKGRHAMGYCKYIRKQEKFERLMILCPSAKRNAVLDALYADGFNVTFQGPPVIKFPMVDVSRTRLIAERQLK